MSRAIGDKISGSQPTSNVLINGANRVGAKQEVELSMSFEF